MMRPFKSILAWKKLTRNKGVRDANPWHTKAAEENFGDSDVPSLFERYIFVRLVF